VGTTKFEGNKEIGGALPQIPRRGYGPGSTHRISANRCYMKASSAEAMPRRTDFKVKSLGYRFFQKFSATL